MTRTLYIKRVGESTYGLTPSLVAFMHPTFSCLPAEHLQIVSFAEAVDQFAVVAVVFAHYVALC